MAVDTNTLPVVEIFLTIQGEGNQSGQRAVFVRTGNCNLHCTWCDSWYTWDDTRERAPEKNMTAQEILSEIDRLADLKTRPLVIITGGEPLMHARRVAFKQLLLGLRDSGVRTSIETNGTIVAPPEVDELVYHYSVSPKVFAQGDKESIRLKPKALEHYAHKARLYNLGSTRKETIFKVVCQSADDVRALSSWCADLSLEPRSMWVMPEGDTFERMQGTALAIVDEALAAGFHFSYRTHVAIWGDERGR